MLAGHQIRLCDHADCRRLHGHSGEHDPCPSEAWSFFSQKDKNKLTKAGFATPRGGHKGAYQNHVVRSNKVVIPFERLSEVDLSLYRDGYVIRLFPEDYFRSKRQPKQEFLRKKSPIKIGENAFILYRSHSGFEKLPPLPGWRVRSLYSPGIGKVLRRGPSTRDRGHYVIRFSNLGRRSARSEGPPQGLFATEYADTSTNFLCKCVLAWLTIHTSGSPYTTSQAGHLRAILRAEDLLDADAYDYRGAMRHGLTSCPLCLRTLKHDELHGTISFADESGTINASQQTADITRSTVVNLFHLRPLIYKELVHIPRNVAWGHAICNSRLGQRQCYSLREMIEMGRKVALIEGETYATFGWMSSDDIMIRSPNGAVWAQLNGNIEDGPPEDGKVLFDEAAPDATSEGDANA